MSFLDLARKRQSDRAYLPKPVPREAIERCLEAARLAPSACNSQPWYFIVVDEPKLKADLMAAAFSGVHSMNRFADRAPVLVVVVTDRMKLSAALGSRFRGVQYSLIDVGIAVEHFCLQAAEEGLGTCWLGWLNERRVARLLRLPRSTKIDVILSLGYPDGETREKKRKSLDEIRRYN